MCIRDRFQTVRDTVNSYREGDGYESYTKVTPDQRKELSNQIDALSATLSQVPGLVLQQ